MDDGATRFTLHLVFRRGADWSRLAPEARSEVIREAERVVGSADGVLVRGVYSAAGLRADADVVAWLIAESPAALQDTAVALRRCRLGALTDLTWSFFGMVQKPEFVGDHVPAFQLGKPPLEWICLYPYVRTADWYLLPRDDRARLLRHHGEMGREFPEIQTNGVQAFGLGDYEWILCFETDRLEPLVRMIRRLREAEARRYTKAELPFVVARRRTLEEALLAMG